MINNECKFAYQVLKLVFSFLFLSHIIDLRQSYTTKKHAYTQVIMMICFKCVHFYLFACCVALIWRADLLVRSLL